MALIAIGGIAALIGAVLNFKSFTFSYLTAFMFFLSLGLGGLILTILHHLFDASWSVPIRRVNEHLACLLPWLGVLFIPILANVLFAGPETTIYEWVKKIDEHQLDAAMAAKGALMTKTGFVVIYLICFGAWTFYSRSLRKYSLEQDKTGSVQCTKAMRVLAASGVFVFAVTLTLGAIMWMKSLQHEWFSTMYGVYYFAASAWTTMATVYAITWLLARQGPLKEVMREKTYYFMGSLMFAFTVFYAYVTFFQYFIIWNANVPEETFFYVMRERGAWFGVSMVVIFGHFFVPFLGMLRIDLKLRPGYMIPMICWIWLMHYVDMSFQVMPVGYPDGPHWSWVDLGCLAFIGGVLATLFLKSLNSHPKFPQKDPRFSEAMDMYIQPYTLASESAKPSRGGKH